MLTPAELISIYSAKSQIGKFFIDKVGQIWVSAYGAIGDGVTDDTVKVQAAVDAAIANGSNEVYFVSGKTYKITSLTSTDGITFLGNNVTITGGANITVNSLTSHMADYVRNPGFATSGGAVNAYTAATTPALSALTDGVSIYLDNVTAANTGASTLNWDGTGAKKIFDSKGNVLTAGKMPLNCIIGLRFNASADGGAGAFQLLGEGGDTLTGNFTADKLLTGYSGYSNDPQTKINGTMPNKVGSATIITPNTVDQAIPQGYYGGVVGDGKVKGDANLVGSNLLADMFGVTRTGKRTASGTGTTDGSGNASVSGLTFTPTWVIIEAQSGTNYYRRSYLSDTYNSNMNNLIVGYVTGSNSSALLSAFSVGASNFSANMWSVASIPFKWRAGE